MWVGVFDAGQGKHGGTEVDRADQVFPDPPPSQVRPTGDQRHVDPRVIGPALAAGEGAVVAPVEHVGLACESVFFQLLQKHAEFVIVAGDVGVHAGKGFPHHRRIGQVGPRLDDFGIEFRRRALLRPHAAFVAAQEVEDREERLFRIGPVPPVGCISQVVPGRQRRLELVVGLEVIGAIVARRPQVLGEALDVVGRDRGIGRGHFRGIGVHVGGPHVMRADGGGVHPRDDGRAGRSAHARRGETARPPATLGREAVHVRRAGHRVAVTPIVRTGVFEGNPQDVRTVTGRHGVLATGGLQGFG